jgi:hypothetical protein
MEKFMNAEKRIPPMPLAVDERTVDCFRKTSESDAALDAMAMAAKAARENLERIVEVARKLRTSDFHSPIAAERALRDEARKVQDFVCKRTSAAREQAVATIEGIERKMEPPAVTDGLANEVRGALRAMSAEKRNELLRTADETTVASITCAPPWLSGCTPEEVAIVKANYRRGSFLNETDRVTRLGKALQAMDRCDAAFRHFLNGLVRHREIEAADEDERKLQSALKGVA